jgi:uncharacterized protein YbjT (DUF2867 family)
MKIVIIGSLGNIGRNLTSMLVDSGHNVVGIGRKSENKQEIEALGAQVAIGSVSDKDFLAGVFTGADAAFTMVPPDYTVTDSRAYYNSLADSFAYAIKKSGIRRIVNVSSWGAHLSEGTGFITGAHDVEVELNKISGVSVTHLRCGFIYYNLFHFINMIKNAGFIGANYGGEDKIMMVAPSDIASAASEELVKSADPGHTVRYVASDDRTANNVAQALGKAIGKPDLQWITFTDEQARKGMEEAGMPEDVITNSIALNASIHSGAMREDYDLHPPVQMGKVKLEDFAQEFATKY